MYLCAPHSKIMTACRCSALLVSGDWPPARRVVLLELSFMCPLRCAVSCSCRSGRQTPPGGSAASPGPRTLVLACCHLPSLPAYSPLALPIGGEKPKSARKKNEWAGYGKQHHARRAQLYLYVLPWGQHRPGHGTCISRAKAARARARARGEGSRAAAAPSEIPMQFAIPQPSLAAHPAPPSSPNRSPPCHQFDSAPDVAREPRRLRASRRCLSAPSPKQPRSIRWGRDAAHAALVAFGRPRPPRPLTRDYARWQPSSRAVTRHSICGRQGLCSVSGVSQASRRLPRVVEHNPGTQSGLARPRAGEEETLLVRAPWHWRRLPQSRSLAHIFLRAFPPPLLTAPPV